MALSNHKTTNWCLDFGMEGKTALLLVYFFKYIPHQYFFLKAILYIVSSDEKEVETLWRVRRGRKILETRQGKEVQPNSFPFLNGQVIDKEARKNLSHRLPALIQPIGSIVTPVSLNGYEAMLYGVGADCWDGNHRTHLVVLWRYDHFAVPQTWICYYLDLWPWANDLLSFVSISVKCRC